MENTLSSLRLRDFLADESKPHQFKPNLKIKGADCKALVPVFAQLSQELCDNSEYDLHVFTLFQQMAQFVNLLDTAPMMPEPHQIELAQQSMAGFLKTVEWLRGQHADDPLLWSMQYKHHNAWHLAEGFKFMNPKFNWCFKAEDFVGRVATIGHSVVHGSKATVVNLKLFEKYRFLLHLKVMQLSG